jgi:alkylation response protein AidB-like acyl-CoA dehydrogenase
LEIMTSAEQILSDVDELGPTLAARAREIEALRTVPEDIIDRLREIGIFRMLTPKSHGGLELPFPSVVPILSKLAEADGSTGWTAMIGCGTALLYSRLPQSTFELVYHNGPDAIMAGTAHALGTAQQTSGGYRVSGRWPFASGSPHADWIMGGAKVAVDNWSRAGAKDEARYILFALPADQWRIEDTWYASGLKGSSSHHVALDDVLVPDANCFSLRGPSCVPGPLYTSVNALIPFFHAAFAVGLAKGACDDIRDLASGGKKPYRMHTVLRNSPIFQYELGRTQADWCASSAYLTTQAERHWSIAKSGGLECSELIFESMQMGVWVTATCTRVVDQCYTMGGGTSVYDSSPLQRRLRDMHAATQHMIAAQRHYASVGALALGLAPALC